MSYTEKVGGTIGKVEMDTVPKKNQITNYVKDAIDASKFYYHESEEFLVTKVYIDSQRGRGNIEGVFIRRPQQEVKDVKPLFNERATPFHQTVISIQDAFDWLKEKKKITGRINDFADVLKKLGCERVGEVKHKRTGRKPTMWLLRNFDFFCDKSMASICNEYWLPTVEENYGPVWSLSSSDISIITNKLKEIDGYEEYLEVKPDEDPEEDFEAIRKARKMGSN